MKKHNFYAGPSILSPYTIQKTADAVLNFADTGLSVLEVSHRSKEFQAVMDEAQALTKELLQLPDDYHVLFLGGGASLQFCMVPFNILETKAAYLNTGTWATNAIKEARIFGEVEVLASSEDTKFNYIPKDFTIPSDVDYFHFTSNNTIYGTEIRHDFDSPVPVVCDMSSDIFSREFDPTKYGIIYAGAQKNLAPSGVTIVIVKESLLGHVSRPIPTMLDYRTHIKKGSMFNTPPVLPIYSALQTLKFYKEQGGVKAMEKKDLDKAALLYDAIDASKMFVGTAAEADRSIMNVCFVMRPDYAELEKDFLDFATSKGIVGIKGHRSVGGFRASLYNALPEESVKVLVDAMKEFEAKH
ncbi:MAG: 3-phosphoserine/phosphohydroxythreonine transaminase [Muribaculaceae bacterium]|nr:3-phosphoserine/phosphohydroxythreonine transaminase [Muribaculaceae bacterium]